nr:MAG TPA: hypothetical protein [Caudoviricetes sp.]
MTFLFHFPILLLQALPCRVFYKEKKYEIKS